jgi:hypothetical protein
MPKVKDFKERRRETQDALAPNAEAAQEAAAKSAQASRKRRPGRESVTEEAPVQTSAHVEDVAVVDVEEGVQSAGTTSQASADSSSSATQGSKIEIEFPGSELLRAKFPLPFNVAESVATEWINDGDFSSVKLPHSLATEVVKTGLRKAKDTEKKVLASPVTEKLAMQAFTYGLKAQGFVTKLKKWSR